MTMVEIWLTAAAGDALQALPPAQAEAVNEAIGSIPAVAGQRFDVPGAFPAEPFLATEPRDPAAPVVIYRRATTGERGDWLVVSLMDRADYRNFRAAERQLSDYPADVRGVVYAAVAGTLPVTAPSAPASTGGVVPTTVTNPADRPA